VEGFVAISNTKPTQEDKTLKQTGLIRVDDERPVKGQEQPVTAQRERKMDQLTELIESFSLVPTSNEAWWNVATPYFQGIGTRLRYIHEKAFQTAKKTKELLVQSLEAWAKANGKANLPLSKIEEAWYYSTLNQNSRSPSDQDIQYRKEKLAALERVLIFCNLLLGPPQSETKTFLSVAQTDVKRRDTLMNEENIEHFRYVGLEKWNPDQPGLYLNFDWDDKKQEFIEYEAHISPATTSFGGGDVESKKVSGPPAKGGRTTKTAQKTLLTTQREPIVPPYQRIFNEGLQQKFYQPFSTGKQINVPEITKSRNDWIADFKTMLRNFRDNVIGMWSVKQNVASFIRKLMLFQGFRGMVNFGIFGNPGSGKSFLAEKLSDILYYLGFAPVRLTEGAVRAAEIEGESYIRLTKSNFVAPYEGQSSHLTRMTILRGLGMFIGIDEAYQLVSDKSDAYGTEALTQLVNDIEEYQGLVSVGLLGYEGKIKRNLFTANEGLARRITNQWILPNYTEEELYIGLKLEFEKDNFRFPQFKGEKVVRAPTTTATAAAATGKGKEEEDAAEEEEETRSTDGDIAKHYPVQSFFVEELDVIDILEALVRRGVLDNMNMGMVNPLVEKYKSVYADKLFSAPVDSQEREMLRKRNKIVNFEFLKQALFDFAFDMWNLKFLYFPGYNQKDIEERFLRPGPEEEEERKRKEQQDAQQFKEPLTPRNKLKVLN